MTSAPDDPTGSSGSRPGRAPRGAARPGTVYMSDIARLAGVSMATTSRALNDLPGVAPATREKVLRVAAELSYVVSPEAAALSSGATGRVAVVAPHLSRWFFGEMLNGIEAVLRSSGRDLLLYHIGNPDDRERFFTHLPARRKVDAVIVVGIPVTAAEQERLELMGVEIVAAGGQMASYPYVSIDDVEAGNQAVNHLLRLGHRRIAMIDAIDPNADVWPVSGRSLAYTERLEAAGIAVEPDLFRRVAWGTASAGEAMAELLSLPEPPTAVFAHSDELAFGALSTIRRAGLRVPEDVSVIGVDGHPVSEAFDLTTIGQDVAAQGRLAAQLVLDLTAGTPVTSSVLPTRLVPRGSTAPPRTP